MLVGKAAMRDAATSPALPLKQKAERTRTARSWRGGRLPEAGA